MPLDVSGAALGTLIANALALPEAPVNPTPAQTASYLAAKAQQVIDWTTISQQILTYLVANTIVNTTDSVPALGLTSPGGTAPAPVTGTASGTGIGTIK